MNDFKLKLVLSILSGIIFSFVFIILAFAVPVKEKKTYTTLKPKGKLEQISQSIQKR